MRTWLALAILGNIPSLAMAIRCGSNIIDRGSSSAEVTAYCGPPAQVDRSTRYIGGGALPGQPGLIAGSAVEVQVEVWTYNFGPNMLMERIKFENGIAVQIDALGYGYNEP
jgi:Protein of unknown function (DUF2845)